MTTMHKVWDPFVRVFHWTVVAGVLANAVVTDPEHQAHRLIGYGVALLLLLRLLWGIAGPRFARFASFPPSPGRALGQVADLAAGRQRVHLGHTPLGAFMIYNLLLTLAVVVASGYAQTTLAFWGLRWVKELHEGAVTWLEVSAAVHVAAVLWESRRSGVNLPRAMVTGYKAVPEDAAIVE